MKFRCSPSPTHTALHMPCYVQTHNRSIQVLIKKGEKKRIRVETSAVSCFCRFVCNSDSVVKFGGCDRLRDGLWKPDLASLHRTQGTVELNCKLRTAHRKCLFIKQTYMYFMAATLLLFYFGRQLVDISTWLQSNFLCFSSPFFFFFSFWATLPTHTHSLPTSFYQNRTAFLAVAIFIFMEV